VRFLILVSALALGCGGNGFSMGVMGSDACVLACETEGPDAGPDSLQDAPADVWADANVDASPDATIGPPDATVDALPDAGHDATEDAPWTGCQPPGLAPLVACEDEDCADCVNANCGEQCTSTLSYVSVFMCYCDCRNTGNPQACYDTCDTGSSAAPQFIECVRANCPAKCDPKR